VPRHQQIVSRILGETYATILTKAIGFSEIVMAFWIVIGIFPRLNAWTQIIIIATMNILEFMLVPDLLLWGKTNALFAFLFILLIYYKAFILDKNDTD
jgi:DoxX-like family